MLLSFTGYIFALQWSGAFGCLLCLLHAVFRPPVARALRHASRGCTDPELEKGDGDVEGGGAGMKGRGRAAPVNANIRLRSRPGAGGAVGPGMAPPFGAAVANGAFRESGVSRMDPAASTRQHAHGN